MAHPHDVLLQGKHLHTSLGLWGHLSRNGLSQAPPSSSTASSGTAYAPPIAPLDKAGASTRILLHDTQAHLEKFIERVTQLASGVADAKRELVVVQKLYQEDHEQLIERMIGLANRCQTELQKTIGSPAQCLEVLDVSRDVGRLTSRLEALDKKMDILNMSNQTQSQALQTIQDQQGQILTALLPILPLLQSVPLHIESARKHVEGAVSGSGSSAFDSISGLESHVKESQERLRSTINDAVSGLRDDIKKDVLELRDQLEKPISELRQQISTSTCSSLACGSAARMSRSRSRSRTRSRSQKRPRPTYPDDPDSSDLTTSPSDSKKRRLGGHPLVAAALSVLTTDPATPVISGQRSRAGSNVPGTRIHSLRVAGATSHSSSASPKVPLSTVVARASKKTPLRTPLADLTPQVPKVTPNASTPRSTSVSSVVKQTRGSRSVPHSLIAASAGLPSQGFSSSQFNNQDPAPVLPRRSMRSSPPTATFAAPITPGSFKLPLPALRPSRASTFTTHTPPQLHPSSSLLRHPALGAHKDHRDNENKNSNNNSPLARSSATAGATLQPRTPAQATRGTALHLSRPSSRAVAVQVRASPSRLPVELALRTGIGADLSANVNTSGTPRTPRLPVSISVTASDGPTGSNVLPESAGLEKGKPMSLKDRRALLAAERLRDEGKRFIPLDDEDDEDVYLGG